MTTTFKHMLTTIGTAVVLAFTLFGCAGSNAADQGSAEETTTEEAVEAETSADATHASSTDAQGVALGTGQSSAQSSKDAQDTSSESSKDTATNSKDTTDSQNAPNQQMQGGFGGGGLDTMPGQTTDKGYTATDSGIALTATLNVADAFTDRDLEQSADTTNAQNITLANNATETITEEGVYVVSGSANDATIVIDAPDTAKVQLVLDSVSITNKDFPAIYVISADKVFITLNGTSELSVTGEFRSDGDTNTDAVIFSKDDLCLNGNGSLTITSTDHCIVSKDDLKVTGGTYTLNATGSALRANDSVRIAGGTFTITGEDGIKAKNDDDNELGYVYIQDGTFDIKTTDNGIQGYAFVWIDGGTFNIDAEECIEGTSIQINDGTIGLTSSDDAINASIKSSVYTPTIEINGGAIDITMAAGDTDALDSNGYLYINGGKVNISAQFAFDYAWGAALNGGEVYVNGERITEITESMMGPGGGFGGGQGGFGGGPGGGFGGGPGGGQMLGENADSQDMGTMEPPSDMGQGDPGSGGSGRPDGNFGGPNGQGRPDGNFGGPNGQGRPDGNFDESTGSTDTAL